MPVGITYENSFTELPGWVPGEPSEQPRGYAYENAGHFIHFFGRGSGLWVISSGLTFFEEANGPLNDWASKVFGAHHVVPLEHDVGTVVDGVWRPGLFWEDQILQALGTSRVERRAAEQSLQGLIERLNELLLFIEPEHAGLDAYGPRSRELLILACTEVENAWTHFMSRAGVTRSKHGFGTTDYVRLHEPLHLGEYQVSLVPYSHAPIIRPFDGWDSARPTQSLPWYDAYNKTKHDRTSHLADATLRRCFEAVGANLALFCARFGPFSLYHSPTPLGSLVNHLFNIELVGCEPSTFYVPLVELPPHFGAASLGSGESVHYTKPWVIQPLVA